MDEMSCNEVLDLNRMVVLVIATRVTYPIVLVLQPRSSSRMGESPMPRSDSRIGESPRAGPSSVPASAEPPIRPPSTASHRSAKRNAVEPVDQGSMVSLGSKRECGISLFAIFVSIMGIISCLCPANGEWCYIVTLFPIGCHWLCAYTKWFLVST